MWLFDWLLWRSMFYMFIQDLTCASRSSSNNILCMNNHSFYYFYSSVDDIYGVPIFSTIKNNAAMRFWYVLCVNMFSFLLSVCLGVGKLGHIVLLSLPYWGNVRMFSRMAVPFTFEKYIYISILCCSFLSKIITF